MFEELSQRLEDAVRGLRGQGSISETNVDGALKEVRRALLEAGDLEPVALGLVETHYDPAYRRSTRQHERPELGRIDLTAVTAPELDRAAEAVAALARKS
jgi:signal recognition particle GTPase